MTCSRATMMGGCRRLEGSIDVYTLYIVDLIHFGID